MELRDAVTRRRMVRSYDPDRPVPRQMIDDMLRLALRAPSAGHTQGWSFLVLSDITSRNLFWTTTTSDEPDAWVSRVRLAPVLILCFSDKQRYLDRYAEPDKGWSDRDEARWPIPYWHVDTGMAALILLLTATERGLGACFSGVPHERWPAVRAAFAVPERLTPIGMITLGYPAPDIRSPSLKRGRRAFDDVVAYETFR